MSNSAILESLSSLFRCIREPCSECLEVKPRVAFPAPPHGLSDSSPDVIAVGLNPQLRDYKMNCSTCHMTLLYHAAEKTNLICPGCSAPLNFVMPLSFEEWIEDGACNSPREFLNRRLDVSRLENKLGRNVVLWNLRLSSWASRKEGEIWLGTQVGGHMIQILSAAKPKGLLVYNETAWSTLRLKLVGGLKVEPVVFATSGAQGGRPRRHRAEFFAPPMASEWNVSGIFVTQAQDGNYATNESGLTRRQWCADKLAEFLGS